MDPGAGLQSVIWSERLCYTDRAENVMEARNQIVIEQTSVSVVPC